MASQQLYSYLGRAALWRNVQDRVRKEQSIGDMLTSCGALLMYRQ